MKPVFCLAAAVLLAAGAVFVVPSAIAAESAADSRHAGPPCDGAQQDPAACRREAGAAKQERRQDGLTDVGAEKEKENALARCDAQPAAERAECEARVRGTGHTSKEGSVLGGGVIRKTETPVPAKP